MAGRVAESLESLAQGPKGGGRQAAGAGSEQGDGHRPKP